MLEELSPEEASRLGVLAVTGIIGGGVLSYVAVSALREKGWVDLPEGQAASLGVTGSLALAAAGYMTIEGYREIAGEFGWGPLVYGTGALVVGALLWRAR